MRQEGRRYPSNLSDAQWELIKCLLPLAKKGGRPRTTDIRQVVDAIIYVCRSGCAWRYLPSDFPPWQTVYDYFWKWQKYGVWDLIYQHLYLKLRKKNGQFACPSILVLDSQSTKAHFGESRGYDGFKKVRGRKRHLLTDTSGLMCGLKIGRANEDDREPGFEVFEAFLKSQNPPCVREVWADGGYRGGFSQWTEHIYQIPTKVPKHQTPQTRDTEGRIKKARDGLKPNRWVVERTFAWLNHFRRLTRDYERRAVISKTFVIIALAVILINRITESATKFYGLK